MDARVKPAHDEAPMAKEKARKSGPPRKMTVYSAAPSAAEEQAFASSPTLHDLFQQQAATMLERASSPRSRDNRSSSA